ncbi:sugar 3,4-ketoisomerase [Olivibacter domesticus]|uniref:WxcM-like, C-terminal n=1 Tax=Olivibacter domesticus TaxID=407022 RepID=A0A1H7UZD5_OLID1|nr:FdtA/QdtA family cupin domain-containing protein [Olivibacter domesticus]SEM02332.1 WxcM-like, C-terminal [Olivibacter domesticus]
MKLNQSYLIELPKIFDDRGNLSFLEGSNHIPFEIARTYWIYDVPGGEIRGAHAFKQQEEIIIALSGSFDIVLNDGKSEQVYSLNRSYKALYVPKMIWRSMQNFSTNAVALVAASTSFNVDDYIRDFDEFCKIKNDGVRI